MIHRSEVVSKTWMEGAGDVKASVEVDVNHQFVTDHLGIMDKELALLAPVMAQE